MLSDLYQIYDGLLFDYLIIKGTFRIINYFSTITILSWEI